MWTEITKHISQSTGRQFGSDRDFDRQSVSGGSINQAYLIRDRYQQYFVKVNTASKVAMFEAEAIALRQMYTTQTIRVPQPICWGAAERSAYIVMEWLELGGAGNWELMGQNLAALHRITSPDGFGWQQANTIGSTPQINTWTRNWVEFLTQHRLGYQLQLARKRGFNSSVPDRDLFDAIPHLFQDYQPLPSMVHGDLWGGNAAFSRDREPVIFDPALYFGDREVDIAMTELFGGFPAQFYQAYDRAFPLDSGYKRRKTVYNLYHILNHFNLFGGGYGHQANRAIEQICTYSF
ncbi:fructosamine kinase family protein [Pseudanabaena sp. PCC 6802]|uniref:fructosamine kinase family protein n=1 Tax=Pseudanabaena sp. PCC 6802 TaxID=118173 RepID=UPI00034C8200